MYLWNIIYYDSRIVIDSWGKRRYEPTSMCTTHPYMYLNLLRGYIKYAYYTVTLPEIHEWVDSMESNFTPLHTLSQSLDHK